MPASTSLAQQRQQVEGDVGVRAQAVAGGAVDLAARHELDHHVGAALYGLESLCYLTTGLVDRGLPDYSIGHGQGRGHRVPVVRRHVAREAYRRCAYGHGV
jgi:hypothetical protein